MNLKTFKFKRIVNDVMIMTEPTLLFSTTGTTVIGKIIVDEYYACRIDLIALEVYGDSSYADYILKYNNISNPFSIAAGDTLLLPARSSGLVNFNKPVSPEEREDSDIVRDKFLKTKNLPVQDQKRIEYLRRKALQYANGASEILPPNVLKPGKKNITIQDGQIKLNGTIDLTK